MSVKHVFLSVLASKPMHGYELKEVFENLLLNQWPLNYGQVYATLSRLERDGYVQHELVGQEELPDKKVYSITSSGKDELSRWLGGEATWSVYHDDIAIKTALFEIIGPQAALALAKGHRRRLFSVIKELTQMRDDSSDLALGKQIIIERNILRAQADLEWIDMCLRRLGELHND